MNPINLHLQVSDMEVRDWKHEDLSDGRLLAWWWRVPCGREWRPAGSQQGNRDLSPITPRNCLPTIWMGLEEDLSLRWDSPGSTVTSVVWETEQRTQEGCIQFICHAKKEPKKAGATSLISDNTDLKEYYQKQRESFHNERRVHLSRRQLWLCIYVNNNLKVS